MTDYCKYGDPYCPCQDGDPCHYEPPNPLETPIERLIGTLVRNPYEQRELEDLAHIVYALQRRIDDLEGEDE